MLLEVIAAAEAECEATVRDANHGSAALPTPPRPDFSVPRHRLSAVAFCPVGLLHAEDRWIGLASLLADVLPIRVVVKAHAMTTLTVAGTFLACKVAMVHSNPPPFWPPVFLGAGYYNTRNKTKVKGVNEKLKISTFAVFVA
ncbi:MAG: hypothetical protein HYS74_02320 [Parcubacteria group bacterium]|nr:hypothetical protein [Parcubacteria group bacterium]